jgi:hypothetical protein
MPCAGTQVASAVPPSAASAAGSTGLGSRQWARSGQARENAMLQGYLAQGYSYDDAMQIIGAQDLSAHVDYNMGRILIWIAKAAVIFIVFVMALGFYLMHKQHVYDKCFFSHTQAEVNEGVCGKDPGDLSPNH